MRLIRFAVLLFALTLAGCGPERKPGRAGAGASTIRLAFFPNVTHAVALVGIARGTFAERAGPGVEIEQQVFNAGPVEIEALFGDQVDIGYIGPGPALNGFLKSKGKALRILAGACSGGVSLVVRGDSGISDIAGLAGKRVASPQIGGTQDISLKRALREIGLKTADKGGNVFVHPMANPDTLPLFLKKELDAAWVPEPWVARLVKEANGKILVDERDRWPGRRFATTVLIVRNRFLESNRALVDRFLEGHVETVEWIKQNPDEARNIVGQQIQKLTKKPIPDDVLTAALSRTDFTYDPLRATVLIFADWSHELGYQREGREALSDLFDLQPLNEALSRRKLPKVD